MLKDIYYGFTIFMLLAICASSGDSMLSNVDTMNKTESSRMSRNSKIADRCTTSDGYTGSCMSRFNCMRQGGAVSGFCGTYGVCCETNVQCGASSRQKTIIIRNPVVLPISNNCPYIIQPYSTNVCQLHIYFERFSLEPPTLDDDLVLTCGDQFAVNGLSICGNNDGQHIYVPFNVAGGMDHVQLEFLLPNGWAPTIWRLVVTQLECPAIKTTRTAFSGANSFLPFMGQNTLGDIRNIFTSPNSDYEALAPAGCLQYYTSRNGVVRSFNYNNFDGPYLAGMSYAICFRRTYLDSMIQFTVNNFEMAVQVPGDNGIGYDEQCHPPVRTPFFSNDYLMIPQGMVTPSTQVQSTYYCGAIPTGQTIYGTTDGPFVIYFNSDRMTNLDVERGFQLTYRIQ